MWKVHICCLVLGFLLLATSLTHVQGAESIKYTTGGMEYFRIYTPSTKCKLTLPDKTVCSYEYGSPDTSSPTETCTFQSNLNNAYGYCEFDVNIISNSLSGIYTLTYNMRNSDIGEETYYVYLLTGSVPAGRIQVVENENMYLLLDDSFGSNNDRKCEIVYRNGTSETVLDSSWKSPNYWGREGECGLKIEGVSTSDQDILRLQMSSRGAAYTYADFNVIVIPLSIFDIGQDPPKEWLIGEANSINSPQYPSRKYCKLWNPQQKMIQRELDCNYAPSFVTDADEGNWTFAFGIDGKLLEDTIVQEIIVTRRDLQASVSDSERVPGGKSLLCSLNTGQVTDCSFTRPDGKVILPSEGIGNADYSYFGDGFGKGDCGLTIHKVQEEDKGLWKCRVSHGSTQWSGFMNVSTGVPDLTVETDARQVAVKKGSELSLSCSVQTALEYCWFRHPSGLHLRFSADDVYLDGSGSMYVYENTLQQGVCGIKVQTHSSEDSGEWTCNLGILGSSNEDYAVPITVAVSETDVISLKKEVVVSEDSALLKCYSVPLEIPLDYCRFVRPDGKGFNIVPQNNGNTVLGRYRYEAGGLAKGECGLRIVSGINEDEDLGKWTCAARLQGRISEGHDFITLKAEDGLSTGAIVGIVLGSVALLIVIGGIVFLIIRRRK